MMAGDLPTSYGAVDDRQSRAALRLSYEMGARVFDTAANYAPAIPKCWSVRKSRALKTR